MPFATLKPWDLFLRAIQPTPGEVASMISDLRAKFQGQWRPVVQCTGIPRRTLCAIKYGTSKPTPGAARAVWLTWCLVCRPGALRTIRDLATSGRFTAGDRGNPATAGHADADSHVWASRPDDLDT